VMRVREIISYEEVGVEGGNGRKEMQNRLAVIGIPPVNVRRYGQSEVSLCCPHSPKKGKNAKYQLFAAVICTTSYPALEIMRHIF
jgi:hypothetical protein